MEERRMTAKALTAAQRQNLKPPTSGFRELRDSIVRGLSLRVFPSARASWTFRYRPKGGGARTRIVLGEYPTIGLAAARVRADRMRGIVSDGGNPQRDLQARRPVTGGISRASASDKESTARSEIVGRARQSTSQPVSGQIRQRPAPV
jgi:Arm DNA-binding domain